MSVVTSYALSTIVFPSPLNTDAAGNQSVPALARLANGNWFGAWNGADGAFVSGRVFNPAGVGLAAEVTVSLQVPGNQQNPDAAGLADGRVVVSYWDNSTGSQRATFSIVSSSGTPLNIGPPGGTLGASAVSFGTEAPRVTALNDGGFVVVWGTQNFGVGTNEDVVYQVFNANGTARNSPSAIQNAAALTELEFDASVSALTGGGFVVAFQSLPQGGGDASRFISYRTYDANGAQLTASTFTGSTVSNPEVVGTAGGGFTIVWTDVAGGQLGNPYFRTFNASGAATGSTLLATSDPAGIQTAQRVDLLSNGFHLVQYINENGGRTARVSILDAAGNPVVPLLPLDTADTNFLDIAGLADGRFVAGWERADTSGAGVRYGVYELTRTSVGDGAADTIVGDNLKDFVFSYGGADNVSSGGGADVVVLGDGNDTATLGDGTDYGYGGIGDDNVSGGAGIDVIVGELGDDTLSGGDDLDYLFGGDGIDTLNGEGGVDVLLGGEGADNMTGGDGGDYFYGENANDSAFGEAGNDIFVMAAGNDSADGGAGQDYFYMGDGDDSLVGGAGVDVMLGEGGNDTFNPGLDVDYVFMGTGSDTLLMDKNNTGVTVLYDFTPGTGSADIVSLAGTGWTSFTQVQAAITDFTASAGFCILTLDGDTSVWFIGIQPNQLTAGDFVFGGG